MLECREEERGASQSSRPRRGPDHGSHVNNLGSSNENHKRPEKEAILYTANSFQQRECWDRDADGVV